MVKSWSCFFTISSTTETMITCCQLFKLVVCGPPTHTVTCCPLPGAAFISRHSDTFMRVHKPITAQSKHSKNPLCVQARVTLTRTAKLTSLRPGRMASIRGMMVEMAHINQSPLLYYTPFFTNDKLEIWRKHLISDTRFPRVSCLKVTPVYYLVTIVLKIVASCSTMHL